jgi:hypothetical protein
MSLPAPEMARAEKFMMWLKPAMGAITIVNVAVLVPFAFVAESVTVKVPAAEGVPVIAPVAVFIDRPGGRPLAE